MKENGPKTETNKKLEKKPTYLIEITLLKLLFFIFFFYCFLFPVNRKIIIENYKLDFRNFRYVISKKKM